MNTIQTYLFDKAFKEDSLYDLIKNLNDEGYSQLEITSVFYEFIERIFDNITGEEEDALMDILDAMDHWVGNSSCWIIFNHPWTKEESEQFYKQSNIIWGRKRD